MKKTICLICIIFAVAMLASCGSGINDGTYSAQMSEPSEGYTDMLSITYSGGSVSDAVFESIHEDGALKSETTFETYPMTPHPSEWIPQLSENVKNADNADDIEMIAGVTISSNNAKAMMMAIEEKAKAGDTNTAMVGNS